MTPKNPYAWLMPLAAKWAAEQRAAEEAALRPRLALVTPEYAPVKTRKPKMRTAPDRTEKKAEMPTSPAATPPQPARPERRKVARHQSVLEHVAVVHNALEAVRSLARTNHGTPTASALPDALGGLERNHLADLLAVINDRLGVALEMEEA